MMCDEAIFTGPQLQKGASERPGISGQFEEECLLPWESKDPNVRRFYENNQENLILDQIIAKEIEDIEQAILLEKQQAAKKKKASKNASQFSDFYNFMSELTKKLKQRIKKPSKSAKDSIYKFRRQKEVVISNAKYPRRKAKQKSTEQKIEAFDEESDSLEDVTEVKLMKEPDYQESEAIPA